MRQFIHLFPNRPFWQCPSNLMIWDRMKRNFLCELIWSITKMLSQPIFLLSAYIFFYLFVNIIMSTSFSISSFPSMLILLYLFLPASIFFYIFVDIILRQYFLISSSVFQPILCLSTSTMFYPFIKIIVLSISIPLSLFHTNSCICTSKYMFIFCNSLWFIELKSSERVFNIIFQWILFGWESRRIMKI